jgi:hypothetical protein
MKTAAGDQISEAYARFAAKDDFKHDATQGANLYIED